MQYQVQRGDTIAKVTQLLNVSWKTLRRLNPHAVGQSSQTGRWFLKEGADVQAKGSFESVLHKVEKQDHLAATGERSNGQERWIDYTIKPGDTLWALAVKRFHVNVEDLIKDNGIKDPRRLQPGRKIRVRIPSYPRQQEVMASWYGDKYHGKAMANGEPFNMYGDTIAHRDLPMGTRVELKNPETGQRARAVVTDRGPYVAGRHVDLSYGLAQKLSLVKKGIGKLVMRIL